MPTEAAPVLVPKLRDAPAQPKTSLQQLREVLEHFQFGRPQFYAALLLLAFLGEGLWLVHRPFSSGEESEISAGLAYWRGGPVSGQHANPSELLASILPELLYGRHAQPHEDWRWLARLPFLALGLWLGGGLWWVARRLYGNVGGYVALALYSFSVPLLRASSGIGAEIITAWGLFGVVFTAIGVAHTLYAPPVRWWPRVLVLSLAIGFAVAAQPPSIIVLPLALAFMLYLAPGRRLASLAIIALSSCAALLVSWMAAGFSYVPFLFGLRFFADPIAHAADPLAFRSFFLAPSAAAQTTLLAIALVTYIVWRRSRYFGNSAPLLAALFFLLYLGYPGLWALPFLFVFAGGMFADLLEPGPPARAGSARHGVVESRSRQGFLVLGSVLLVSNAVLALIALGRSLQ